MLSSVLLSFGILEVSLRVIYPETQFFDSKSDSYWKAWLRQRISQQSNDNAPTSNIVHNRRLGWIMKPFYKNRGVSHNSYGFRGSREFDFFPQGKRILFIGDSFTYGLGVNDEETFAASLEQVIDVETINAGVNGYGIDQALLMWEDKGKQFNPDIVILGYFVDDFFRNANSIRYGAKPYFLFDRNKQEFSLRGVPVPDVESLVSSGAIESEGTLRSVQAFSWLLQKIKSKLKIYNSDELQLQSALSEFLLKKLNDSIAESGGQLIVLIIGHCYDGIPEYSMVEASIIEACHLNSLECINLAASMRKEDYNSFYGKNCHWSSKGHRYVANVIAENLILKRGLKSSKPTL